MNIKTTLKQKYCNAIMGKKTKGTNVWFEYMDGDDIWDSGWIT